ncbi:MAG TPA: penicillin-binding transpeptidase domain-containing protein [Candidatus Methylacidiphilales bacterium]|nr:penicillin-binding transpeptidase domain-containing protein [Candidatus Methylacidiphilales bacterium]
MLADDARAQGWRLGVLALAVFAAVGLLLNRLWTVQITNSASAQQLSNEQTTVRNRIAPARGAICDRNGVMLAENRPSFDIDFYLGDLRREYQKSHKGNVPYLNFHPYYAFDPHIPRLRIGQGRTTTLIFPKVVFKYSSNSDQVTVKPTRDRLGLLVTATSDPAEGQITVQSGDQTQTIDVATGADPYHTVTFYPAKGPAPKQATNRGDIDIVEIVRESIAPIKDVLGLSAPLNVREIREHYDEYPDLPYHYMTDLDFATVANFEERNAGVTGIRIAQNPARQYTYGAFAAHILGYVGKPNNQDEHLARDGTPYEVVGRHGIEAVMDSQLQGEPGSELKRVSSQGYIIDDPQLKAGTVDPTMGATLYLTIDARVQYIVETALRHAGVGRAAAIVMNPQNGDVLAMASVPSYDPNKFIPKIQPKDWDALNNDPTAPMFNRVLHAYAPGSTYKIMVALAGLKSGNVTTQTIFNCPGAIQIDDHLFHNSDSTDAGDMALVHAICVSSDVFFYQYGMKTGIEAIDAMGKLAGFGQKWGLLGDEDEDAGIMPGPQWMKDNDKWLVARHQIDHWSRAQTANTSIGQGFVLCTPLQMATFLCSVANGGTVYRPRLYSRVVDYKGDQVAEIPEAQVFSTLGVKPADLKAVQEGMREVVAEGTAQLAQVKGYEVAGKTGTAQAKIKVNGEIRKDLKCWFYCYGPAGVNDTPRYVTCVVVEGGVWGGTTTAPIAQEIMSRLFAMDKGATENIAFLQPALGNFNGLGAVDTATNPNSGGSGTTASTGTTTPTAPVASVDAAANGDVTENNDASASAPAADAPPASARSSSKRR